ncbi:unnamed protein product [Lupinus luteus]|uniref:Solute carrier family 25 member 44 n=1 Tax=Lupinus luteus TaxID=3873 RepID=A0AAV1Y202_LUPLU
MSLSTANDDSSSEIHIPEEIDWHMLDKSKFFFLGAALFYGVSAFLYPMVVLKTRQQCSSTQYSCLNMSCAIMRYEGFRGFSDTTASAVANGAAGVTSAMAAQLVWTPIDVVSQRIMVQGCNSSTNTKNIVNNLNSENYRNGFDAFRKILCADGAKGLYRGFGISILTYAPSNAVWWTSYSVVHRLIWDAFGSYMGKRDDGNLVNRGYGFRPDSKAMVGVQGLSAVMASGVSAIMTMPFDTVKTRLQVLDSEESGRRRPLTFVQSVKSLVNEGGLLACYRGIGPRWASMSMSATTMITTYEFLKRVSTKSQE